MTDYPDRPSQPVHNEHEAEIKCKLIDYLLSERKYTNWECLKPEIILNEYAPSHTRNRSDIMAIYIDNGFRYLVGYEIKSEKDTLKRLDKQLKWYLDYCDWVYLILTPNHEIPENLPSEVGVWLFKGDMFEVVKLVSKNERKKYSIDFYWKEDLCQFLLQNSDDPKLKISHLRSWGLGGLQEKVGKFPDEEIRSYGLKVLSKHYNSRYQRFIRCKKTPTRPEDLELLSGRIVYLGNDRWEGI